jgi:hypothetical protein
MADQLPLFDASNFKGRMAPDHPHDTGQLFDTAPYQKQKAAATTEPAHHHINHEQLQMFMTPKEIKGKYQALDGDRQSAYSLTANSRSNGDVYSRMHAVTYEREEHNLSYASGSGTGHRNWLREGEESDDQLYARKADEARLPPGEYAEIHSGKEATPGYETLAGRDSAPQPRGSGTSAIDSYDMKLNSYVGRKQEEHYDADYGPSLYEQIESEGVKSPVHLSQQFGSLGKPMVVGGHHRLASQGEINEDQPIPVMHHTDFHAARQSGVYT